MVRQKQQKELKGEIKMQKLIEIDNIAKEIQENFLREQILIPQIAEQEAIVNDLKWQVDFLYSKLYKENKQKSDTKLTDKAIEANIKTNEEYKNLVKEYLKQKADLLKLKAKEKVVSAINKHINELMIWIRYQLKDQVDQIALAQMMEDVKREIDYNNLSEMWNKKEDLKI